MLDRLNSNKTQHQILLRLIIRNVSSGEGLNMGRVYTGSGKIQVGYISDSSRIRIGCILILRVSDQPNEFRAPFPGLFLFLSK